MTRNVAARAADMALMQAHSHATVLVHIVWSTQRRARVLPRDFDGSLAVLLRDKAQALGCPLLGIGVAPDHVHVVARLAAAVALANLVQRMKGGSAHDTNAACSLGVTLRWQGGYWAESLAPPDVDALLRYLGAQRARHDDSHPAEMWQMSQ
jgi:REP element-mobilizing transposase RayT